MRLAGSVQRGQARGRAVLLGLSVLILAVLVVLPMWWLVVGSLREDSPGFPSGLTLDNYRFLGSSRFLGLLRTSLVISVGSTMVSLVIGLGLAIVIVRTKIPAASTWDSLVLTPAYITPFIGALGWTLLLSPNIGYLNAVLASIGLPAINIYSIGGIIWVMGLYYAPIAYLYLRPSLLRLDQSLEEGSRVLGANTWTTMRRIVLPLTLPALLSSLLIVFVNAIGQFGIPGVLGVQQGIEVVPTYLIRLVTRFPADPNSAAVMGIALTAMTVFGLWMSNRVLRGRDFTTVGTKGAQPLRVEMGPLRYLAYGFLGAYLILALILPVGVMLLASFQPFLTTNLSRSGFTLANYEYVFSFPALARSIRNSALLAVGAAVAGTTLSVLLSYIVVRTEMVGRSMVDYASTAPVAIPHTVFGLGMLWAWISIPVGVYGSRWILLFAYVALFLPYAMRSTTAAFQQIDVAMEDASRVIGAGWITTVRRIVVPLLRPALVSGAVIILYHSVRELPASLMLHSVGTEVMSVTIWNMYADGRYVQLFALAIINIAITMAAVFTMNRFGRSLSAD